MNHGARTGDLPATLTISGMEPVVMSGRVTVGREPTSTHGDVIAVDDDLLVSNSHLCIDHGGDGFVITDLGSANGTYLYSGGTETAVPTGAWVPVPYGATIAFGDHRMTIDPAAPNEMATGLGAGGVAPPTIADDVPSSLGPAPWEHSGEPTTIRPGPPPPMGTPSSGPAFAGPVGGPVFADQHPPPTTQRRGRGWWKPVLAVIVALAVVGGGLALVRVIGDGGDTADAQRLLVPDQLDGLWTASVDGEATGANLDDDSVYVGHRAVDSGQIGVVRFDRESGDETWSTDLDGTGSFVDVVGVVDGVVVVTACDEECIAYGVNVADGDELWSESIGDGFAQVVDGGLITVVGGTVELLEPATGTRSERVRGDESTFDGTHVMVFDGDDVEVFDLDLERVLGPVSVTDADDVAFDGSRLVVAQGDELRFVDEDGSVTQTSTVDVGVIEQVRPVDDETVILGSDEGVIAVDPTQDVADELWSARGEIGDVAEVDVGPVVQVNRSEAYEILDAESGESLVDGELDRSAGEFTIFGRNALLVYSFGDVDESTDLSAIDWQGGDQLWSESIGGFPYVRDGLVVGVASSGDVNVLG